MWVFTVLIFQTYLLYFFGEGLCLNGSDVLKLYQSCCLSSVIVRKLDQCLHINFICYK